MFANLQKLLEPTGQRFICSNRACVCMRVSVTPKDHCTQVHAQVSQHASAAVALMDGVFR